MCQSSSFSAQNIYEPLLGGKNLVQLESWARQSNAKIIGCPRVKCDRFGGFFGDNYRPYMELHSLVCHPSGYVSRKSALWHYGISLPPGFTLLAAGAHPFSKSHPPKTLDRITSLYCADHVLRLAGMELRSRRFLGLVSYCPLDGTLTLESPARFQSEVRGRVARKERNFSVIGDWPNRFLMGNQPEKGIACRIGHHDFVVQVGKV